MECVLLCSTSACQLWMIFCKQHSPNCLLKKNSWHFKRDDFQDYFGTDFYILEFITSNGFFSQIVQDTVVSLIAYQTYRTKDIL